MKQEEMAKIRERELSQKIINSILLSNKDKNFVDRIINPDKYPVIKNNDGSYSTHLMAYGEVDGKNIAYPTLFYNQKTNSLYKPDDPVAEALKTGNFIPFNKPEDAEWFTKNYKLGMKGVEQ